VVVQGSQCVAASHTDSLGSIRSAALAQPEGCSQCCWSRCYLGSWWDCPTRITHSDLVYFLADLKVLFQAGMKSLFQWSHFCPNRCRNRFAVLLNSCGPCCIVYDHHLKNIKPPVKLNYKLEDCLKYLIYNHLVLQIGHY